MNNEKIIIIDFGGQYKELIARRVRECGVYSEILPHGVSVERIKSESPVGIILTGGPDSVYKPGAPMCDRGIFELGIPVLGICYGMQLLTKLFGGEVSPCEKSEYGTLPAELYGNTPLFDGIAGGAKVLMSHTDRVSALPEGFVDTARTLLCPIAAFANESKRIYGVQFHPETENTDCGKALIGNFLFRICGASGSYTMNDYLDSQIAAIRERVGDKTVLLGLSGGVDSSVCAALLEKAIGDKLVCIYIDHGFMRKGETEQIKRTFGGRNLRFICADESKRFIESIRGITDPETKRRTVGAEFAATFEREAKKLGGVSFLAQGTIYPDVVESGTDSAVIKSHHNVGGLPEKLGFEGVVEPLRMLFKDEVRCLGLMLGLPKELVFRQPFPGPGLSIRIIGEVTEEKLSLLRNADAIVREEIMRLRKKPNQYFAVLTDTKSVGVMGDERTYDYVLAVRAVQTNDFMTCEYSPLSHKLLSRISSRITSEVKGINRVVYDITPKPPATIEWE